MVRIALIIEVHDYIAQKDLTKRYLGPFVVIQNALYGA